MSSQPARRSSLERMLPESSQATQGAATVLKSITAELRGVGADELKGALERCLAAIARFSGAEGILFFRYVPNQRELRLESRWLRSSSEWSDTTQELRLSAKVERVLFPSHTSLEAISYKELRLLSGKSSELTDLCKSIGAEAVSFAPLRAELRRLGFLMLWHKRAREWSLASLTLQEMAAHIISTALKRYDKLHHIAKEEKEYDLFIDSLSEGSFVMDEEGRFITHHHPLTSLLRLQGKELNGRLLTDFVTEEQRPLLAAQIAKACLTERETRISLELIRDDGSACAAAMQLVPFSPANEERVLLLGALCDRVARRRAIETLAFREGAFKTLFEQEMVGLALLTPQLEWIAANAALCRLLGFSTKELYQRSWRALSHRDELKPEQEQFDQLQRGALPGFCRHKRFLTLDNESLECIIGAYPLRFGSAELEALIVLVQPLELSASQTAAPIPTPGAANPPQEEINHLQRQLMQAQKMEAIGQLAAGVAHDLNNALGAVMGHLQLINMSASLNPQQSRSVEIALSGCERASTLVQQLLGFARRGKYNLIPLSLSQLVAETVSFLRKVIGKNIEIEGIDPSTTHSQDSPSQLMVMADAGQLQQALTNLIINSTHAMPAGGTIQFEYEQLEVNDPRRFNLHAKGGTFVKLSITDTGCGIHPDNLERIFEPFYSTKHHRGGTGLGLSMVYGIMQSHGGWISVESKLGRGWTFTLYLPHTSQKKRSSDKKKGGDDCDVNAEETFREDRVKESKAQGGTILIIDDEPSLVQLTSTFLEKSGFTPKGFTNPGEAIKWFSFNHQEVELIILDMRMPGMSGEECFSALRALSPTVEVIVLSGYIQDATAERLLSQGAARFFQKPLKYQELIDWIKNRKTTSPLLHNSISQEREG